MNASQHNLYQLPVLPLGPGKQCLYSVAICDAFLQIF